MKLPELNTGENPDHAGVRLQPEDNSRKLLIVTLIFFVALGVRLLNWQGHHNEALAVQSSVALNYKHQARLIQANGVTSLFDPSSSTNDPDLLGHPPGYPILLSLVYRLTGERDIVTQLLQLILDSLSVVIITLIAFKLFPTATGVVAATLCAFAPQFSWNAITLLPDSLAALPILLALLLITHAIMRRDRNHYISILAAGALVGVSCWLRANALLLAPFLALSLLVIAPRRARLRPALILLGGALLVIGVLTVRNARVFGQFIPVSLGAGQTLVEGIADYNTDGSLGLPQTDMELIRGEAETYQRPDYAGSLFTPDGVARDRARLARGFAVIRTHPFWFAGLMLRRSLSMLRLERTPLRLKTSSGWSLIQWPLRTIQNFFITALFLPLSLIGAGMLVYQRQFQKLAILLAVPCYYFCAQSALHTEYRYVLVIHYFLFILAAIAIYRIGCVLISRATT
jgi:hypothetical protein